MPAICKTEAAACAIGRLEAEISLAVSAALVQSKQMHVEQHSFNASASAWRIATHSGAKALVAPPVSF